MKLKKIASLALAGVMAVSMLAGCAGKTGTTNEGTTVVTTSSIVTALNNGQSAGNKVKITFTGDSTLDAGLKKALEEMGATDLVTGKNALLTSSDAADIYEAFVKITGEGGTLDNSGAATVKYNFTTPTAADTQTALYIFQYDGSKYWTESDVINEAVRDTDAEIAKLTADDSEGKGNKDTFYHFSYTGKAGMVTVTLSDGSTYSYVYGLITRTSTEDKIEA